MSAIGAADRVRDRGRRVQGPLLVACGIIGVSVLLHLRDPHQNGSWGFCPWLVLTGTFCPGCGGLRAVNDLTRGDFAAAASSNLLFVGSLPVLAFYWSRWLADRWRGLSRTVDTRRVWVWCVVCGCAGLLFAVARNLPAGQWLAP